MKYLLNVIILSFLIVTTVTSQIETIQKIDETIEKQSYKMDAAPFLEKSNAEVTKFLNENPFYFEEQKLKKTAAWDFTVGSTKEWWATNISTNAFYKVPSTCQSVGTHCYIFVEDAIWNSKVTIDNINSIKEAFDNKTPANSSKGIYETVVGAYGNPPNVDGDDKIIILVLDIKDGYDGSGGYVAGYFHSVNEITHTNSNMAEIYYLDADPADLSTEYGLDNVMGTTAHEFQHMIHFNYHNGSDGKPSQLTFLNEACSMASEVVCGYEIRNQTSYNNEFNHYLFDWRDGDDVLTDYARAAKYMTYFYDQFGTDFLGKFVQSSKIGVYGIDDALSKLSTHTDLRFTETLLNWFLANEISDITVAPEWGYKTPNVTKVNPLNNTNPNYTSPSISLQIMGSDYVTYSAGENLAITFDDNDQGIVKFKAIKYDNNNNVTVEDIAPNVELIYSGFGIDYKAITFVAMNTNQSFKATYSYTSTGETSNVILAYDENPPTGVLGLSDNDTVCVVFDGVLGGTLDSISVALRQAGAVRGGIYEYTGPTSPSPLGKVLIPDLMVISTIAEKPGFPYPEPWTNWVTVDLSSHKIDASKPFVAAFLVKGEYPKFNRIMVTSQPDNNNNHSFTYLIETSSGSPGWYVIGDSESENIWTYLIRAYISFGTTDIKQQIDELFPSKFDVRQNFPNPFNPSTTINYSIAKSGFVTLKIYNMLGQEIANLVNENKSVGNYSALFDASQLSSGTYLYKLSSGNQHISKKMILIK
jgi:hypothetical protein